MRSRLGGRGRFDEMVPVTARRAPAADLLRAWDALVDDTPGTDVTQLSTWARLREMVGFTPLYVLAHQSAGLAGGALIMIRRVPLLGAVGYLPYGPLVASDARSAAAVRRALADALAGLCRRQLRMLFVQPPEGAEAMSEELLQRGFRTSSAGIAPAGSIRIDLTADLADIRSRFGKRLKSWTNRWQSRGVAVRIGDERDIPLLIRLMATSSQHQGYHPLPDAYVLALYRELAATGHAALFVGEVEGVPIAADLVTGCAGMVRGRLSGFDRCEAASKLSVPAAVRWEILKWAKASGYRWLDFGGLRPETLAALLHGEHTDTDSLPTSDQPKVTFGGTAYRYPTPVEMIRPIPLRLAYDLARRCAARPRQAAPGRDLPPPPAAAAPLRLARAPPRGEGPPPRRPRTCSGVPGRRRWYRRSRVLRGRPTVLEIRGDMNIVCVGGGPAGLYFAISAKLRDQSHRITVVERNPAGVTYGWGVTFSEALLDSLYRNDQVTAREIALNPASWGNQEVRVRDNRPVHLGGYGYAVGRQFLLDILARRAQELGVDVQFDREVDDLSEFADADLVIASDGANSRVRQLHGEHFRTDNEVGRNKYIWLGTHRVFDSFIFAFEETAAGWIWFYAYRFNSDTTTFIVECASTTWERLGFDVLGPDESLLLLEDIFKRHLDGYSLINPMRNLGKTPWLNFVRIGNAAWYHDNVVLMGDAAHTTHFSIGSGTTLAMQDAIALAAALHEHADVGAALEAYQEQRRTALLRPQGAALNSTRWFENVTRYLGAEPTRFAYDLWKRRGHYPPWRYQLHLATQVAALRKLRCSLSVTRRELRARRRAKLAGARRGESAAVGADHRG